MTTADTESVNGAAQTLLKAGTHRFVKGVFRFGILPIALAVVAQFGGFVRQDIWALSLWWLLPLVTLVAIVVSFVRSMYVESHKILKDFEWKRFSRHPFKVLKRYRQSRAYQGHWQAFRVVALEQLRNRAFTLVVPLVVFLSFFVLILGFGSTTEALWSLVAGNQNFGQNGLGLFSLLIVFVVSEIAVSVYWKLMRLAFAVRFPKYQMVKIIAYTALVPLAFVLVIGCSITINSGF